MRKRAGKSDEREKGAREERTALLSASSNIPRATLSFPFARGPRRFCRLNAINDLIPVITVLIYRARGGSDFLWLCVSESKTKRGRKVPKEAKEESFFSSCGQQLRNQLDLIDKTAISLFVIYRRLTFCNTVKLSIYLQLGSDHYINVCRVSRLDPFLYPRSRRRANEFFYAKSIA